MSLAQRIQDAITNRQPQVLAYLSELPDFDPDVLLPNTLTPLLYSLHFNLPGYVNFFLNRGADPNHIIAYVAPLHLMSLKEHQINPKNIQVLLNDPRTDPNIYSKSANTKTTPLISAIIDNNIPVVKLLLEDPRTDPNRVLIKDRNRYTPLTIALQTDKTPNKTIVKLLQEKGAVLEEPSSQRTSSSRSSRR